MVLVFLVCACDQGYCTNSQLTQFVRGKQTRSYIAHVNVSSGRTAQVNLRHDPAAKNVAIGVAVGGHRDELEHQFLISG